MSNSYSFLSSHFGAGKSFYGAGPGKVVYVWRKSLISARVGKLGIAPLTVHVRKAQALPKRRLFFTKVSTSAGSSRYWNSRSPMSSMSFKKKAAVKESPMGIREKKDKNYLPQWYQ